VETYKHEDLQRVLCYDIFDFLLPHLVASWQTWQPQKLNDEFQRTMWLFGKYFKSFWQEDTWRVLLCLAGASLQSITRHNMTITLVIIWTLIITGNYWTFTVVSCFQKPTVGQFGATPAPQRLGYRWRWPTGSGWLQILGEMAFRLQNWVSCLTQIRSLNDPNGLGPNFPMFHKDPSLDVAISGTRMR
jgi:hypothetical protein